MISKVGSGFPRTSPEQQGIDSAAVLQFVEAMDRQIQEVHSFMLARHGHVVAEGWWDPYGANHPHLLFSLSKSVTATAVGLAVAEGCFSIDEPVRSFFPEALPATVNDFLAAMRVQHLLSMSTGHAADPWTSMVEHPDGDWIKGFLAAPVSSAPGSQFVYNTGATYMLSAVIQKTTGMTLQEYLVPRLFEPLGIGKAHWQASPQGITLGGIGLSLTTEDVARFGQLYLQQGMWEGRRLIPQPWIEAATAFQIATGEYGPPDWTQGYGYQFWRCRHGAYRGDGVFGQYCVVMPDQDAVLAITGGMDVFAMQEPLDLVWDLLLPAMGDRTLAEDTASHGRLTEKLGSLRHQPVQGQASSPVAARVSGRSYHIESNALNLTTITLEFTESGCTVSAATALGEERIPCGYGVWKPGQTTIFNQPFWVGRTPVVASGAWTAEDTFAMVVRLYETPFVHTLVFDFAGDELLISIQINVSLESLTPLLLLAHLP